MDEIIHSSGSPFTPSTTARGGGRVPSGRFDTTRRTPTFPLPAGKLVFVPERRRRNQTLSRGGGEEGRGEEARGLGSNRGAREAGRRRLEFPNPSPPPGTSPPLCEVAGLFLSLTPPKRRLTSRSAWWTGVEVEWREPPSGTDPRPDWIGLFSSRLPRCWW